MQPQTIRQQAAKNGFTILELMAATTVLILLLGAILALTNSTADLWRESSAKSEAFQAARVAFETLTRNLSQATLNTYWGYDSDLQPTRYLRKSDLHFISGPAENYISSTSNIRHCVFFQAPLGVVSSSENYGNLTNLLNVCGYFVEISKDDTYFPAELKSRLSSGNIQRYRLVEVISPTEKMSVYTSTAGDAYSTQWINDLSLSGANANKHILADNVIVLVLLPKLSAEDEKKLSGTEADGSYLAPDYVYDSRIFIKKTGTQAELSRNQLPPLIEVVMVAIDQLSARRLEKQGKLNDSALKLSSLFQKASKLQTDLDSLETQLIGLKANYRIFRTDVLLRQAKWSET